MCLGNSADGGMQAQHLLASGQADAAIAALQAHVKQWPTDAAAWNLLSRAYLLEEKWDAAISAGEKATSLDPNDSAAPQPSPRSRRHVARRRHLQFGRPR